MAKQKQEQSRNFPLPDNPLRTVELSSEENCNMIDGIINNGGEKTKDKHKHKKESIMRRIERHKTDDAKRSGITVAGYEPPERTL